jgi:hypothetical protein
LLEEEAMEVGEEGERKGEVNRCRRGENGGVDEVKLRAGAARKAVLGSGGRRRSGMRRAHTDAGRRARWVRGS